jgi:hypothetical protein
MIYYMYNIHELKDQYMCGEYICYKHNCIFIPKKLDKKYQISNYYYQTFNIRSLFKIDPLVFKKIMHIKIDIIE